MSDPFEQQPQYNPVETLRSALAGSHEYASLQAQFEAAYRVVTDLSEVNTRLQESVRPDLVITEPFPVVGLIDVDTLQRADGRRLNNFIPNLMCFGMKIEGKPKHFSNRRPLSSEELRQYFVLGARGDYRQTQAVAEANGIEPKRAGTMMTETHIMKPAFMRMWLLFPRLTEFLMVGALDSPERTTVPKVEIFIAHAVMAYLVDRNDYEVIKSNGEADWYYLGN